MFFFRRRIIFNLYVCNSRLPVPPPLTARAAKSSMNYSKIRSLSSSLQYCILQFKGPILSYFKVDISLELQSTIKSDKSSSFNKGNGVEPQKIQHRTLSFFFINMARNLVTQQLPLIIFASCASGALSLIIKNFIFSPLK